MNSERNSYFLGEYENVLAQIPSGRGQRNSYLLPKAVWYGLKAGIADSTIREQIKAASMGIDPITDAEISHALKSAQYKIGMAVTEYRAKRAEPKRAYPNFVRKLISDGYDIADLDSLTALSPIPVADLSPYSARVLQLQLLFPDESNVIFIFHKDAPRDGKPGVNLMEVRQWTDENRRPLLMTGGDLVVSNPLTGRQGCNGDGEPSYISKDCIASYPHLILEFDDMPLEDQCRFWGGFIRTTKSIKLVTLTYSGGKSIHGAIRVGAKDIETWYARRTNLIDLFASDTEQRKRVNDKGKTETFFPYRADEQAMRPRQAIRLAGIVRTKTGKMQRLLYASR